MWCSSFVLFFDVGVVKVVLFLPCSLELSSHSLSHTFFLFNGFSCFNVLSSIL